MPALAEIFTTTEVVKKIYDISGGIEEYMVKMKQSVLSSAEQLDDRQMGDIAGSVNMLSITIKDLMQSKKSAAFSEPTIIEEIFNGLRE